MKSGLSLVDVQELIVFREFQHSIECYPLAESEMAASIQNNRINLSADKLGLE